MPGSVTPERGLAAATQPTDRSGLGRCGFTTQPGAPGAPGRGLVRKRVLSICEMHRQALDTQRRAWRVTLCVSGTAARVCQGN